MNTYNNNLMQQQHLQQHQNSQQGGQQPQQQQPSSLQPDQAMNPNNMDPARLQQWQMRYGQNAAADMNHAKFTEMIKRNQVANQFGRHPPQQSFAGLGMQQAQNGANPLAGNPQQQSFHEQQSSNMTQQSHLPQAFPNMGVMSNGNANAAASASLQSRNPSGVLPGSQTTRPHDMMGMMQGQQPQNNSVNANKFPQPSQQIQFSQALNQGASPDMFPDGIRRPSPHPGNAMQQGPGQVPHSGFMDAMSGGTRPQNIDFPQRLQGMHSNIKTLEAQQAALLAQIASVRGNPTAEAQLNQRLNFVKADIAKRKEMWNKVNTAWKQQQSQHHSIAAGNGGQPSNNQWAPHSNSSQPFDSNGQTRPPSMGLLPHQPTHPSPNLPQVSAQPNLNSGLIPPRTIPTPQPHASMGSVSFPKPNPLGPPGSQTSIGVQGGNVFASSMSRLGLDKVQFDSHFTLFLSKRGLNIDHLRVLENRPLDLYALHLQVTQEGGFSKIEGNEDLWSIVAARLGHVQFPGSTVEPAKSGPGVAQVIQHLYKEYIAPFETWYMAMLQEFRKQRANVGLQAALTTTHYTLPELMQMVNMPPAELQSQGVDEKTMQILEMHKVTLQRLLQERVFAEGVRNNAAQNAGHSDQNGSMGYRLPGMGPSPPFGPGGSQQPPQQSFLPIAGRQQLQNPLMQPGGQHLQSTIPNGGDPLLGPRMSGQQMASSLTAQAPMGGNAMQNFAQKAALSAQAAALRLVERFRNEYAMSNFPNANLEVPIEQQMEYTQLLEQLHRQCAEVERRLPFVAVVLKDDESALKGVITTLCAVNQQRNHLSSASGPRYIVSLDQLKAMANHLGRINAKMQQLHKQRPPQPPQIVNNPMAPPVVKQEILSQPGRPHNRPPSDVPLQPQPPQPPSQPQPPLNPNQGLRPPAPASLQPPKRKPPQTPGGSAAASTPSPAPVASAPTPVANTPTPTATASSPPATKSPKAKATSKSKTANAKQRRPSKVVQSVTAAPAVEETKPTPPATSVTAGKRPREEESTPNSGGSSINLGESSAVANEGSPPKRVKTEWESQPSEAQRKQSEVVANVKTDEDAAALLDQMTELIKRAAEEEGGQPSSITSGISETLDMLLKGYGPVPDAMDGFSVGESSSSREPDAAPTLGDPFDEFFDFSFGTVEDEDSKTPDLVSSSSTNPSPESNHDTTEPGHHLLPSASSSTIDIKTEDLSDPLRLGTWKEIDGGEAAYFHSTEWKYDSPMPSYDQPWAIFNS